MQASTKFQYFEEPSFDYESGWVTFVAKDYQSLVKLADSFLNHNAAHQDSKTQKVHDQFQEKPKNLVGNYEIQLAIPDFQRLIELAEKGLALPPKAVDEIPIGSQQTLKSRVAKPRIHNSDGRASCVSDVWTNSMILKSESGKKLGANPLDFLSAELADFETATKIFSTETLLPRTRVADDFHKACDNVPNVLVIIKSGQYIAGGYTEVPFESRAFEFLELSHYKPNEDLTTFVFSANKRKTYALTDKDKALNCDQENGPSFGWHAIIVEDDYNSKLNCEGLFTSRNSFACDGIRQGELFGSRRFQIDAYEVFRLE